ncbi:chaperonin 10-like protein [Schizophyllum amplum]|uniref:Chaperonin 10-like protein n=2 Tax=Schizophyllum amplum TaxID=97359 RepID=A0A550BWN2_9AGAR|nr:chaperonin 10-like protein [Auriculariopsis ampla]
MRAVLIKDEKGPAENLYIGDTTKPTAGEGEVLVQVKAFGLNRLDILQRQGNYPPPPGASSIMGVELSGVVVEIGGGVAMWKEGDEVMGLVGGGAYAEFINVTATHLFPKPEALSWVQAAVIPEVWLTAFQSLITINDLQKGEDVLIHAGASGVGVAATQLSHLYGANRIFDFSAEIQKITEGKGVNVILDFVGQSHWQKNINSLAMDGRLSLQGLMSGGQVPDFNLAPILGKRLRIQGSTLRSRSKQYQAGLIQRFAHEVMPKMAAEGPIAPTVYPWTQIVEAHTEMEADKNIGKIVVEVV